MKKSLILFAAVAAFVTGCRVVEVDRRGQSLAVDSEGNVVKTAAGEPLVLDNGWDVYHNQHWMWTKLDTMEAHITPDDISFQMGGLHSEPSSNLVALVDTSFTGACNLTGKIAAAIVTAGGSEAGSAAASIAQTIYNKFKSSGGDETKATVSTSADGTVTVTDGTVTQTAVCTDGSCTVK